jgi:hypothetical protein
MDLLQYYKRGIKTGVFIAYEMALWLIEFNVLNGLNTVIIYENGETEEIRNGKDFKKLVQRVHMEAVKDKEIREILEKVAEGV